MSTPIWKIFLYIALALLIFGLILYFLNKRNELMWLCFIAFPFFLFFSFVFWLVNSSAHEVGKGVHAVESPFKSKPASPQLIYPYAPVTTSPLKSV